MAFASINRAGPDERLEQAEPIDAETPAEAKVIASWRMLTFASTPVRAAIYDPDHHGRLIAEWDRLSGWTDHQ